MDANTATTSTKEIEWSSQKCPFELFHVPFCRYSDNLSLPQNDQILIREKRNLVIGTQHGYDIRNYKQSFYEVLIDNPSGNENNNYVSFKQFTTDYDKKNGKILWQDVSGTHSFITQDEKYIIAFTSSHGYAVYDILNDKWLIGSSENDKLMLSDFKCGSQCLRSIFVDDTLLIISGASIVYFFSLDDIREPKLICKHTLENVEYEYKYHAMCLIGYSKTKDNEYYLKIQLCGGEKNLFLASFLLLTVDIDMSCQSVYVIEEPIGNIANNTEVKLNLSYDSFSTQCVVNANDEVVIIMIGGITPSRVMDKSMIFYNCSTREINNEIQVSCCLYMTICDMSFIV